MRVPHETTWEAEALFHLADAFRELEIGYLERSFPRHGQFCGEPGLHHLERGGRELAEALPRGFCPSF